MWREMSFNKYSNRDNELSVPSDVNYCGILEDITINCCLGVEEAMLLTWEE